MQNLWVELKYGGGFYVYSIKSSICASYETLVQDLYNSTVWYSAQDLKAIHAYCVRINSPCKWIKNEHFGGSFHRFLPVFKLVKYHIFTTINSCFDNNNI